MVLLWSFVLWIGCSETKSDTASDSTSDTEDPIFEGGDCVYNDYEGTCVYESGGVFTYTGTVEDEEVSFENNPYTLGPEDNEPATGSSIDCVLSYITNGTCTPCLIDIGECGSEAFAGMP